MIFSQDKRAEVKEENPDVSFGAHSLFFPASNNVPSSRLTRAPLLPLARRARKAPRRQVEVGHAGGEEGAPRLPSRYTEMKRD